MKLVVGLGNPGKQYLTSRHNIGFVIVDSFIAAADAESTHVKVPELIGEVQRLGVNNLFLKPTSYMNNSGKEVEKLLSFFKISHEDMLVVHDDVDLSLGEVKLEFGRGSAGHRGVESIINSLGTKDFNRLRVGIGRSTQEIPTDQYVLENFTAVEHLDLSKIKESAHKQIQDWLG